MKDIFNLDRIIPKPENPAPRSTKKTLSSGLFFELPAKGRDTIISGLEKIKKSFEDSRLERATEYANEALKSPDLDSDEELLAKVKESLDATYADKQSKAKTKTDSEIAALAEQKKKAITEYDDKIRSVDRKHSDKERRAWEALSRNGMTNSSVFDLRKQELEEDHVYDRAYLEAARDNEIKRLNARIEELESEYRSALGAFEIDYALKLEEKLSKLKAQRDKTLQSFEKTKEKNIGKKESEFLADLERKDEEYEAEFGDYDGDKKENYEERLRYAVEAVKGLSEKERKAFLNNNDEELKTYLGLYYDRFREEIGY